MFNFERSGLSQKLTIMSVLSTGSALLLVFVAFAATSVLSHSEDARQQLACTVVERCLQNVLFDRQRRQRLACLAAVGV